MRANADKAGQEISRAFIALPVAACSAALPDADVYQNDQARQLRWVAAENLHLTLVFLGRLSAASFQETCAVISQVAAQIRIFEIRFTSVAPFPQGRSAKVLAALPDQNDGLNKLQHLVAEKLQALAIYQQGRAYRPHITLARLPRSGVQLPPLAIDLIYTAATLHLYQSEQTTSGVRYRSLHHSTFVR